MFSYLISAFIFLILALIFFLYKRTQRQRKNLSADKYNLNEVVNGFEDLKARFNDDSQYLRYSKLLEYQNELQHTKQKLLAIKNIFLRREIKETRKKITDFVNNIKSQRDQINMQFFQKEKEQARHIFCDENGKDLLTEEQIKAILSEDNRNLIIAGAGSGKTRVIDFKVRYLVNHKKVDPGKIILLTFSNKSAGDLVEKISESVQGIEARTIHSFGSQTLKEDGKKLFDEKKGELKRYIIQALVDTLKERKFYRIFKEFYDKFFTPVKPLIFYKNLSELRADLKKMNSKLDIVDDRFAEVRARRFIKTLKGEYVRSIDERYIADFLYLHNVDYTYEKKYPYSREEYIPDFHLTQSNVYLEHFALTKNGTPPPYFENPEKYLEGIKWKRKVHRKNKTCMIESYSYLLNQKDTSAYLTDLLLRNNIKIQSRLENEEIYIEISNKFYNLFSKFYTSYKLSDFSLTYLKQKFSKIQYLLFLQLFERFLFHFERLTKDLNKIDFSDLLIEATKKYKSDFHIKNFEYIIVDEFQDTSNLAMKFLNSVYQSKENTTLFSVGDDWQSIYGFNGSDVTILSAYDKIYSDVSVQKLNSNFRSHEKIVSLGKYFISKNPTQISKDVVSKNNQFKNSDIDFLSFEDMEEKIRAIPDDESIFVLYRYNADCPAGRGVFKEYFELSQSGRPLKKKTSAKDITLMTIHGSKGLEARHVFVLFPDGVKRKFPSEIEDHFVFNMLKTHSDDYPFAEERRLMYVAITRAEQNLYFVSPNGNDPNSIFWDELKELNR